MHGQMNALDEKLGIVLALCELISIQPCAWSKALIIQTLEWTYNKVKGADRYSGSNVHAETAMLDRSCTMGLYERGSEAEKEPRISKE